MLAATVFNIQKYSIHDGPGIRTTVFLKGCPLACWWCHNPESLARQTEIIFLQNKCMGCGSCVKNCPQAAIAFDSKSFNRNKETCSLCGICVDVCPTAALEKAGTNMTVADVLREVEKDSIFYEESGGGVTLSGGEPLQQLDFLEAVLAVCNAKGIHTALDTSGYAPWQSMARIADKVDLFLYDIKLMDDEKHRKYTGVSNKVILENLRKLAAGNHNIWVRIPLIPGINDDEENIERTGAFMAALNLKDIYLLPYHNIAIEKYARLGKPYQLADIQPLTHKKTEDILQKLHSFGLHAKIGG